MSTLQNILTGVPGGQREEILKISRNVKDSPRKSYNQTIETQLRIIQTSDSSNSIPEAQLSNSFEILKENNFEPVIS